ncbi:MAG: hypothetical protein OEV42_20725 [Deltaproteobacteria bacterium]|nr:hypothetical protein [Deltaproteobacteria bacterium]
MTVNKLKDLLEVFIEGKDRSVKWANSVESVIDKINKENETDFEELQDYLASYQPGGGEFLYNEKEMEVICLKVLKKLAK